ncbi:MAG: polyprenyl synthetase family protein, partial [Spirochaetales bacterium]
MPQFWKEYPLIAEDLEQVKQVMKESLATLDPILTPTLSNLLQRNGKMLRPAFVLLGARSKPYKSKPSKKGWYPPQKTLPEKIYRIAAAVEILHLATLIHDDIIDRAQTRRGAPTVNSEIGERNAVLTGDFLFSRCFALVADYATMENARYLALGVSHICQSEIAQSRRFDLTTLSVRNYLHRIIGKTALLFSLSLFVGGAEMKAPPEYCTL